MVQRILSCLVIAGAAVIVSCKDDDGDKIKQFSAQVEATNSSMYEDKYNTLVVFSTDGGKTWVDYPMLKPGDAYKAKVIYRPASGFGEQDLTGGDACYVIDWSQSTPGATGATNADMADFVMTSNSALIVNVSDFKAYNASSWAGKWYGVEDGTIKFTDVNAFAQDPANPNKFILDNYWGIGDEVAIVFNPATTWGAQTVTFPKQVSSLGMSVEGTGRYDQCRGIIDIDSRYIGELDPGHNGIDTVDFNYHFQREDPNL
jgi:hypothetical protein